MKTTLQVILVAALLAASLAAQARAQQPLAPQGWLDRFADQWDETTWLPKGRRPYMRPLDDRGWQVRMRALQALVAAGDESIEPLLAALKNGDTPMRVLAAQALSYLAPHVAHEPLLAAARNDRDAAVRLYAVDALAMQGDLRLAAALEKLKANESNRDAKKHIGYALQRKAHALESEIVRTLIGWDAAKIDSATLGQGAPDFELRTVSGTTVRLSQFRGRSAVVLVFIYGDT